jgi:hypothetical protein
MFLRIFKSFMDKDIDLNGIKDVEPVFDNPPYLDNSGLLCVIGSYATKPSQAGFNLKYLPENDGWKLAGIRVKKK